MKKVHLVLFVGSDFERVDKLARSAGYEMVSMTKLSLKESGQQFSPARVERVQEEIDPQAQAVIVSISLASADLVALSRLDLPILDIDLLILDIFESVANSREAKIHVQLSRLRRKLTNLSIDIGASERQGKKGSSESEREIIRRQLFQQIQKAEASIEEIEKQRQVRRKARLKSNLPSVVLFGPSNAGKSSIMNALLNHAKENSKKTVLSEDKFFSSLDTASRLINLGFKRQFIITDTVGTMTDLIPDLLPAFHSTIEELKEADCVVIVFDVSDLPGINAQWASTMKMAEQYVREHIPLILVLNKVDGQEMEEAEKMLEVVNTIFLRNNRRWPFFRAVLLSTKSSAYFDRFAKTLYKLVLQEVDLELAIPYEDISFYQFLVSKYPVREVKETPYEIRLVVTVPRQDQDIVEPYLVNPK